MIMSGDDLGEMAICCECAAPIDAATSRAYVCSPETLLCFTCAERRGGVYEAVQDRWVIPPDVSGLPDERRAHP